MKKKILSLGVIAILIIMLYALTGCGNVEEGQGTNKSSKSNKYVSVLEIFQSNGANEASQGYDNTKLHIGDFISYDAGSWTEEEISSIKVGKKGSEVSANNSTQLPKTDFEFGGFVAGQSRNESVSTNNGNYIKELDSEGNKKVVSGWRVFDITDDGSIILVSAGAVENFYHKYSFDKNAVETTYTLSGEIVGDGDATELESNYTKRDWSAYVNNQQGAISANTLTLSNAEEWFGKYLELEDTQKGIAYNRNLKKVYNTKYETLIDINAAYWLPSTGWGGSSMSRFSTTGKEVVGESDEASGIRILVTLANDVKVSEKPIETKTLVNSNGTEYTYNVWNIKADN